VNIILPRYISGLEHVFTRYMYIYTLLHFSDLRVLILVRKHTENSQCLCSSGEDPPWLQLRPQTIPEKHKV
jgi:hypothetical protein